VARVNAPAWALPALVCCFIGLTPTSSPGRTEHVTWSGLVDGPIDVGFRVREVEVPEDAELPRRLRVFSWYPALPGDGRPMRYGDYYRAEGETADPELLARLLDDMTSPPGATSATAREVADWTVSARRDARARVGAHPLVIWSARDSIPHMQAALNEYLASWGYVVAFSWPLDAPTMLPWEGATAQQSSRSVEVHGQLMHRLIAQQDREGHVDASRIGLLSWSYGGETAFEFARSEPRVSVTIGIDATVVSGWILRPEALAQASPSDVNGRIVLLRNGRPRLDAAASRGAPGLLRRLRGRQVRFPLLSHGNFNVPGGLIPGLLGLEEISQWARGGRAAVIGYRAICLATRHHLANALGRETDDDWPAELPAGFVEVVDAAPTSESPR